MSINIVREGERLVTKGLTFLNNSEISLKLSPELEIRDAKLLLTSITNYISTTKINIKNEETFPYGFWLIKFIKKMIASKYSNTTKKPLNLSAERTTP